MEAFALRSSVCALFKKYHKAGEESGVDSVGVGRGGVEDVDRVHATRQAQGAGVGEEAAERPHVQRRRHDHHLRQHTFKRIYELLGLAHPNSQGNMRLGSS